MIQVDCVLWPHGRLAAARNYSSGRLAGSDELIARKEGAVDVLLVDDNPLMQQVIARFLGDLGYRVGVAGRADEAVALARATPPSLFMIDMHLPDLDGPDALLALRALPGCAAIPAIAISGLDAEDARFVVTAQFAEFLVKPVDLDVLHAAVVRHIDTDLARSIG